MAISLGGEGKGRRKAFDADLNLVPYIDLLTCMVAFLLITSIWTQLARLEVAQKGQGQDDGAVVDRIRLAVLVSADGFNVVFNDDQRHLPLRGGTLDYPRLVEELKAFKDTHLDKSDIEILSEDGILFDTLVKTMDAAMSAGFPALSLLDARGGM
jgi:biopolymer transport protein TolR